MNLLTQIKKPAFAGFFMLMQYECTTNNLLVIKCDIYGCADSAAQPCCYSNVRRMT